MRTRVINAFPSTLVSAAVATADVKYALAGVSSVTVSYGIPTAASFLTCFAVDNGVDALQVLGCTVTVRNALGLTSTDPSSASPFTGKFLTGPMQMPTITTSDEGATWAFNLTATQDYLLGASVSGHQGSAGHQGAQGHQGSHVEGKAMLESCTIKDRLFEQLDAAIASNATWDVEPSYA